MMNRHSIKFNKRISSHPCGRGLGWGIAFFLCFAMATTATRAQNIAEIAKGDPLVITGAVGTQNTFYHSAQGGVGATRWNNALFVNLNLSVMGINMPFSFTYNNMGTGFTRPYFNFTFQPSWHEWSGFVGRGSMPMSNYVFNVPVNGVGAEYKGRHLRIGAFWGQLRKSINDDPTDPAARTPQFSRYAWGVKAGYTARNGSVDLSLMHAYDRIGSVGEGWYDIITPQENLAVGLKGRYRLKRLSLNFNIATTIYTQDTRSDKVPHGVVGDWDKIFDARLTSLYRFAGDVALGYSFKSANIILQYRLVQPDYQTLGTNYISNNVQSYGATVSGSIFRGRVSYGGAFSAQQDNVARRQLYTTRGYVYNGNVSWTITPRLGLTAAYNGYRQMQTNGTAVVNDTTRMNRIMHSATGALNYNFETSGTTHSIGTSLNMSKNLDLNKFVLEKNDVTTLAASANYAVGVNDIGMTFSLGYSWQNSQSAMGDYTTNMITFGTAKSLLEDKSLTFGLNANLSQNKTADQRVMSFGTSLSANYILKEKHNFSLVGSYNRYNNMYITQMTTLDGLDYSVALNYNYTFELIHITRQQAKDFIKKKKASKQ